LHVVFLFYSQFRSNQANVINLKVVTTACSLVFLAFKMTSFVELLLMHLAVIFILLKVLLCNSMTELLNFNKPESYFDGKEMTCSMLPCFSQEDCCPGTVCIMEKSSNRGICGQLLAQAEGKICLTIPTMMQQCIDGLECSSISGLQPPFGLCMRRNYNLEKRQFFDPCITSIECDMSKQLCCRKQHSSSRGESRQICSYFEDPIEDCIY
ncbi:Prohormone-3, partial [Trichinella zimbabwensis]